MPYYLLFDLLHIEKLWDKLDSQNISVDEFLQGNSYGTSDRDEQGDDPLNEDEVVESETVCEAQSNTTPTNHLKCPVCKTNYINCNIFVCSHVLCHSCLDTLIPMNHLQCLCFY